MRMRSLQLGSLVIAIVLSSGVLGSAPLPSPPPRLLAPADGAVLEAMQAMLVWELPPGATQVHVQVVPARNDGPGIDLVLAAQSSLLVPAPPAWYGLLPDMAYTWRVRASEAAEALPAGHEFWGPWAERTFRTPAVSSATIGLVSPTGGVVIASRTPTFQWSNRRTDVFYYEVQISRDPEFGEGLHRSWAPVRWLLVHGGVSRPPNGLELSREQPLEDNTTHYWRVRPRVQGDGRLVEWTAPAHFLVVTAAGRPAPTPTPTPFPQLQGTVAFTSSRDGNPEVYAAAPDGARLRRLTRDPAADLMPAWSPDGTRLAFNSNRTGSYEVYVIDSEGSGERSLTTNESGIARVAWSPDGAKIAFWRFEGFPNTDIFVMRADGSGVTRLTEDRFSDTSPAWSPDGSKIAFVATRDGNPEIYVMNSDGSDQRPLAQHPAPDSEPVWSPLGTKIAFISERDGRPEIYTIDFPRGVPRRLTRTLSSKSDLAWSPSDRLIAYTCGGQICVIDDEGRPSPWFVSREGARPRWSPDGRKLAYECGAGICILDKRTGMETILPGSSPGDWDVAWSRR